MTPITDLAALLAGMRPEVLPGEWVWTDRVPTGCTAAASVVEPEGPCAVIARADADVAGLPYDFVAAWIVLRVESSLHAVGLTAAVSSALAGAGIACNVLAGLRHDHLLVPAAQLDEALRTLRALVAQGQAGFPRRENLANVTRRHTEGGLPDIFSF